jgi:hypothetical protein
LYLVREELEATNRFFLSRRIKKEATNRLREEQRETRRQEGQPIDPSDVACCVVQFSSIVISLFT